VRLLIHSPDQISHVKPISPLSDSTDEEFLGTLST
jgi:hypothetical protein